MPSTEFYDQHFPVNGTLGGTRKPSIPPGVWRRGGRTLAMRMQCGAKKNTPEGNTTEVGGILKLGLGDHKTSDLMGKFPEHASDIAIIACVGDFLMCHGPPDRIMPEGLVPASAGIFIDGQAIAVVGTKTEHGGTIISGCNTILANGLPVARLGDTHTCPGVVEGITPIPHVGGPIITSKRERK